MNVNQPTLLTMTEHNVLFPGLLLTLKSNLHIVYQGLVLRKCMSVYLRGCLLQPLPPVTMLEAIFWIPCNSLWSHKRRFSTFFRYAFVLPLQRDHREDRIHWQCRESVWFGSREGQQQSPMTLAFKGQIWMKLKGVYTILLHFAMTRMTALLQGQGRWSDKRFLQDDSCYVLKDMKKLKPFCSSSRELTLTV